MNIGHAKLTVEQVHQVRALHEAGFRTRTIGEAFDVCTRTIADLVRGRSWWFIPQVEVPLPTLPIDQATRLRIRNMRRLSKAQLAALAHYRDRLAAQHDIEAEREGIALCIASNWTTKRPKRRRPLRPAEVR